MKSPIDKRHPRKVVWFTRDYVRGPPYRNVTLHVIQYSRIYTTVGFHAGVRVQYCNSHFHYCDCIPLRINTKDTKAKASKPHFELIIVNPLTR